MTVEREVRRIDRNVVIEKHSKAGVGTPCHRLCASPEHSVMHYEKVRLFLCCARHAPAREIHACCDLSDIAAVCELQAVHGAGIIRNRRRCEQRIEIGDDLRSSRHLAILSCIESGRILSVKDPPFMRALIESTAVATTRGTAAAVAGFATYFTTSS